MNLMSESSKSWYAVYTNSRAEKKLALELSKKGITQYLPIISTKKQWSDRIKIVLIPVFPSYVFVKIDIRTEKLKVLETTGAVRLVSIGETPLVIEENDIEMIRQLVTEYPDRIKIEREKMLAPGKKVLIMSGPFKDRKARVIRKGSKSSILVSISGMDTTVSLELDSELLETGEEN
ncbi:transcription termination/antitermination factor NusG [Leptospira licerasiae serovar Varillal str. VAR 010]|uniref:Transcription termination/antitermination factor NusG n=2 Tax=Leptospira licerasiae TaxID=447106 RepID=A0ABP2RJ42_9LEPT|nr:transcription termination/antitermination factor NusG [Leptospira licerasiae serovar Varillal str. VAR 010]EJZ42473.1 transcription termination/antitermination factor NusG [Leptospira licerasiae str. MMD4847]